MSAPRQIPLFPLPLVLFPGAIQPLHIFEPRYRAMLRDCLAGDQQFGVIFRQASSADSELAKGTVGCMANIESSQLLADGRSNIIVLGLDRFEFLAFAEVGTPYFCALVDRVEDIASADSIATLAEETKTIFRRAGEAARAMHDHTGPLPELPNDPGELSFAIAQLIDLKLEDRQRILSSRSAADRLMQLRDTLSPLLESLERGAFIHRGSKSNGKGQGPHA